MMSKAPRWPEAVINKPTHRKSGKASSLTVPVSSRGKQAGNTANKATSNGGRSHGICSKTGVTLKRSNHQGSASRPPKPAPQLCSSQSFSSLHTSSLNAASFMRSSRSLNRLDQRSTEDECDVVGSDSSVNKGPSSENKVLDSGEPFRKNKEQCHGDNDEKKQVSSSSETLNTASSELPTTACLQHADKVEKENKDALCAVTAGIQRNLVQTALENVRPTTVPASSQLEQNAEVDSKVAHRDSCLQENYSCEGAGKSHKQEERGEGELKMQQAMQETSADVSSVPSSRLSLSSSPTDSLSPVNPTQQVQGEGSIHSPECAEAMRSNEESLDQQQRLCEAQTGRLVKELEQTQTELSRLKHELQQERESHLRGKVIQKDLLSNTTSSSEQTTTVQRLLKMNHDLRAELEVQKRIQEEAREAELRRRVDLLAQQAQLLVTGDATALAQAHLEQERQWFIEQRMEWERTVVSLKSQLSISEGKRKESELRATQLQGQSHSYHAVQEEAEELRKALQEAKTQLRTNEDAQAQKEALLQKHLMLLQASQDRERRSLSASLARAEQNSQELQERLVRAEQQVESLNKNQMWSRDSEDTQHQLQEELASSVAAVQRYQDDKEELEQQCRELQNLLSEAEEEVGRLQSFLKTEELHCHDLKCSYEAVSEELQVALQKVQQKEAETQDMREGFENLLDRKEQELNEVLLKMEVLGNSLEETEAKLSEVFKVCTCATSRLEDECVETGKDNEELVEHHLASDSRSEERDQLHSSSNDQNHHYHHARVRSHSLGPSHQYIITSGDDPERFTTVIQLLETKLFVTEERLREITHQLEEHQDHMTCQDPHLHSQLTQSRASAQHLNLLLHSRAKRSRRFAQETENLCRLLSGRLQAALHIIQSCRETLERSTTIELTDFEGKLAAVEACLQQGWEDAEKQQRASFHACKGEDDILSEASAAAESSVDTQLTHTALSDDMASAAECLMRELVVVEKMLAALQSPNNQLKSFVPEQSDISLAHRYKLILAQIVTLKKTGEASVHSGIIRACTDAELIYAAFKIQQQYQDETQEHSGEREGLAHINRPELASYGEQVNGEDVCLDGTAKSLQCDEKMGDKRTPWLDRLISKLQRRAKVLWRLSQEVPGMEDNLDIDSPLNMNWMQEQAKLVYLSERLHLDLEQEQQRSMVLQDKLQAWCKQWDSSLTGGQEAFNYTSCELQEDNKALREELNHAKGKVISIETGKQGGKENKLRIEDDYQERMEKLEAEFQMKIQGQQHIREAEMEHLHEKRREEKHVAKSKETPLFHQGTSSPTEFQGVFWDKEVQQQHEKQVEEHVKDKEMPTQEETAAISAARRAHKEELERNGQTQRILESEDITRMHNEYQKVIQLLNKELALLSLQHTQKCLENSQLRGELQLRRKSITKHREKQRDTNEKAPVYSATNGNNPQSPLQTNDFYEEEILRPREAEMQFLRQAAVVGRVREELKTAEMDKMYSQTKKKNVSKNNHNEHHHVDTFSEDVRFDAWSSNTVTAGQNPDVSAANTSNASLLKKTDKPSLLRRIRAVRSKSLKEGLSVQERMKLFDSFQGGGYFT
ncbi:golgin subfamily A member 4-like isoform X2 [Dunckerocampus dactyliophorus]|uniref:golgin subfamily A member 4-like isoform X2 n=1 Tax=Dunckerocampus dactyliophorus TaxID=161453 RepID=UPI00240692B4|nr:golgin subfamily A member 4-like isoform X2 [Dunckerocampus dactyliophorus]